jgi:hypothetical protein
VVDANAQAVATIRLAHRRDIQRARKITNALLDELEQMADADTVAYLQELGEMLRSPDDNGMDKLNDLYQKVISLPERSKTHRGRHGAPGLRHERQGRGQGAERWRQRGPLRAALRGCASA